MAWPDYLRDYFVQPSSRLKGNTQKTLRYRCDRLAGLTNLYYGSLTWALHRASDWKLGQPKTRYAYDTMILWLIGVEIVGDLVAIGWVGNAKSARASGQSEKLVGSFRPSQIRRGKKRDTYIVKSDSVAWWGKHDATSYEFTEADRLREVDFGDAIESVPWSTVFNSLEQSFVQAETHLRAERVRWYGPPLFRELLSGPELLEDISVRKLDAAVVLRDIEATRRRRLAEIESVLRADVRRRDADERRGAKRGATKGFKRLSERAKAEPHPLVQLTGKLQPPLVCGKRVSILTPAYYAVIDALVKAGPDGLIHADITAVKSEAPRYLNTLIGKRRTRPNFLSDADAKLWRRALRLPDSGRKGYAIVFE